MKSLIMHFLPQTRKVGINLLFNKYFYCLKNGVSSLYNFSLLVDCKHYKQHFGIHCRIPITSCIGNNIHKCSRQNCEQDDTVEEELMIPSKNFEIEDRSEVFRSSLYPILNDHIIVQLKSCDSVKSLISIINDNSLSLISKHYCQFILVLWDLINNYEEPPSHNFMMGNSTNNKSVTHKHMPENNMLHNALHDVEVYSVLFKALDHLSSDSENLSADELVYSVIYFNRLGIHLKNSSIQNMLMKINKLLTSEQTDVLPLSLLSRLSIIFLENDELWTKLFLIKSLPFLYKHFDQCSNADDFKALTIIMLSTVPYLREELLVEYEALTDELLRIGILTKDQNSVIVKVVMLLNHIYHKPTARQMIYRLLQMLNGQVNKLFFPHLLDLQRVLLVNLEPRYTIAELESIKQIWASQLPDHLQGTKHLHLMSLPTNQKGSMIIKDLINQTNTLEGLLTLYYLLTTAHLEACHMFWEKMTRLLTTADSAFLQVVCNRYMMFTYRMGFYRNRKFESHMLSLITYELVTGSAVYRPGEFSVLAAFVLSYDYSHRGANSLSIDIIPRLISMAGQFSLYSCFMLSRGFNQAVTNQRSKEALQVYLQLDTALNVRTREILESQDNISINTFNTLLRTCINRKGGTSESGLLWDIMKRCDQLDWSQLTSRSLRNLVYNLISTSSLVPLALDQMAEYCLDNRLCVTCDTVGKLAHLCYTLGYSPTSDRSFWAFTADLVIRDYKFMKGLSLLQVALALSFSNQLSSSLNRLIFSVDFLERLDDEIKNCFAKDRYPLRVRQTLMQLNRSVCLDNPEADVPWFHSKFCEEQQSLGKLDAKPKSLLFEDVFSTLRGLVRDASYIGQRALTPYGYTVDIQLHLDDTMNPVPFKDSENVAHKLALLLYYEDCYTKYERNLKGYHQMKQRHLEILGYKVIGLSDLLWNAMWMAEPKAKHEYLQKLIWPS